MADYSQAQNELRRTEKKVGESFVELGALDYQRVEHFHDYVQKHRPEDVDRFLKETMASNALLQNIMKDFHKILGYVLLIEKEGHKNPKFKELLKRARYMGEILHKIFKERKVQAKACRGILPTNSFLKKFLGSKAVSFLQEKRLIFSFGKEKDLVILFAGIFKHEQERITALFQAYENEKKKDLPLAAVSLTIMVVVPAVGTALALVVYEAMQWANRYSANYKKLMGSVKNGESNGPAV
ncbi:MAG: hypothetical protein AABX31_02005 [Nanoarchaeota archaeon]